LVVVVSIVEVIIGEAASERRACVGEFLSDKREREREGGEMEDGVVVAGGEVDTSIQVHTYIHQAGTTMVPY
jgi:hypothetical protein